MADQLNLQLRQATGFARDDFVVSAGDMAAVARIDALAEGLLVVVGGAGVGKTHLANAWAVRMAAVAVSGGVTAPDLDHLSSRLFLDDADHGVADEILFHLINRAQRPGGALLMTAQTPPSAWPTALPDLRSRLNAAAFVQLGEPDEAALTQILNRLFRERSIAPSPELLSYLLRRMERSAAGARRIVARLDEVAHALNRPVGRRLARELLDDDPPPASSG